MSSGGRSEALALLSEAAVVDLDDRFRLSSEAEKLFTRFFAEVVWPPEDLARGGNDNGGQRGCVSDGRSSEQPAPLPATFQATLHRPMEDEDGR